MKLNFYLVRYKFQPIQRYKALSAEEAEQEFSKRNKHLNYFSLMLRKRLKGDEEAELDGEGEEKSKKTNKAKGGRRPRNVIYNVILYVTLQI